jgi:hypothetical protein
MNDATRVDGQAGRRANERTSAERARRDVDRASYIALVRAEMASGLGPDTDSSPFLVCASEGW